MDINKKEIENLEALLKNKSAIKNMHSNDVAKVLKSIHENYEESFVYHFNSLPNELIGEVLINLPEKQRTFLLSKLPLEKLKVAIESLETDDATDLLQHIEDIDEEKAELVLNRLNKKDREELKKLKQYDDDSSGAFMQTEIFDVYEDELIINALNRLRGLKNEGELENIHQVFIVDREDKFIGSLRLEDILLFDFNKSFKEALNGAKNLQTVKLSVLDNANIKDVAKIFQDYDIPSIAVVDVNNILVGRITADDIYDIIQQHATKQIYNLAGIGGHGEAIGEQNGQEWKSRATWLFVNLCTMLFASTIIGFFEDTIDKYVALAILMPIIPALSGNAGMQALTVTVRQLSLGQIDAQNSILNIKTELRLALLNGISFSILVGVVASIWFKDFMLGVTVFLALFLALLIAGFLGSTVPLLLKRFNIDPAVGSSVLVTGLLDSLAFFSLFGIATLILL